MFWGIAVLVGAVLTLLLHETSHMLMARHRGAEITAFKPYPHKAYGKWWFGNVSWVMVEGVYRPSKWVHGSSLLVSGPLAILWALGTLWCPYLWVFSAWAVLDILWWFRGYFSIAVSPTRKYLLDGYKFRNFDK